jgi:hypothetical protein
MSEPAGSLLDRASRVLEAYTDHERTMRTVTQLTELEDDLRPLIGSLRKVVTGFAVLDHVSEPAARPQAPMTAADWRTASAELRATRSLPASQQVRLRPVLEIERGAREDISSRWRSYVHSQMPGLDGLPDLAGILSQVGADPHQVANLRSGVVDLRRLAGQMPDAQAADRVADAVAQIRAALAALVGDSDEVRQFINDSTGGGAPISALTPVVLEWMHTHGTTRSFKIMAGRPIRD